MISATVVGRLGRDAEKKHVRDTPLFAFSVASGRGNDDATWVDCNWWRPPDKLLQHLKKGQTVAVSGELSTRVAQDGKTYLQLRVASLELVGSKPQGQPAQQGQKRRDDSQDHGSDDDIPF